MTIIHLLLAWLFIMAAYVLWQKFREDRAQGRSFFNFGDFNFLIASVTVMVAAWAVFSLFSPEPQFTDKNKQIEFGERTRQPWLITDALWSKIARNPKALDLHYQLIHNHFIQEDEPYRPPDRKAYEQERSRIFSYYSMLSAYEYNDTLSDIGFLFLANWYLEAPGHDAETALFCLRQVENREMKYVSYTAGRILFTGLGAEAAEPHFIDELEIDSGYRQGAWENLAPIYDMTGRYEQLRRLVYNPESKDAVPDRLRYKVYFLERDFIAFYKLRFSNMAGTLPLWGIAGNLLVLFTWLFFLRRLSFLSPVKWRHFLLAIGIGVVLAMSSWLLYELYHHVFNFWITGEVVNDFLFSFLSIGMIEELVKLIPFLLLLRFTSIIKTPIDYLLVASAAGLGFAFFENLLYTSQFGLGVIHSRALTASVSHMASSAIAAYGFVLVKYRYPGNWWIIPVFFLLAALAHGFYDFWLLNDSVHSLAIVTVFFFLSEMLIYVSLLNNALNQTAGRLPVIGLPTLNTQRLAAFLAGALVLVFALEYAGTCLVYGTTIGNRSLMSAFLAGGYLIFFLSMRLSNIDIIPGEWGKVDFFTGLLPSEVMGRPKLHYNRVLGQRLLFSVHETSSTISTQLPVYGTVKRRFSRKSFSGWFEVELERPIHTGLYETQALFIRAKNSEDLITPGTETLVKIFLSPDQSIRGLTFFDYATVS